MSGVAEGKFELKDAKVYVHLKGKSGARITHLDVEHPDLNKIIKPKESTFAAGKDGGFFVGLKKNMITKAEKIFEETNKL